MAITATVRDRPTRRASRSSAAPLAWRVARTIIILALVLGLLLPLFTVLLDSRSTPLFDAYKTQLTSALFLETLLRSIVFAVVTTVVTVAIGYPVAYGLTIAGPRLKWILLLAVIVPQVTSLLVRTYSWIALLGTQGPMVDVANAIGFDTSSLVGTDFGVILVLVHYFLPYVVLTTWASMRTIPDTQLRAARSLGARKVESFWTVYAPQTIPGVLAGSLFVFVITAAMYSIPSLVGGPGQTTVAMLIVQQTVTGFVTDAALPAAQATLLALLVLPLVALFLWKVGLGSLIGVAANHRSTGSARGGAVAHVVRRVTRVVPDTKRDSHLIVWASTALALLIIVVPFIYLYLISVQPLPLLAVPTDGISFSWYDRVLNDPSWLNVAIQSLKIGALATVVSVLLGWALAVQTERSRGAARPFFMALACIPLVVPAVTYGQGFFSVFAELGVVGNWVAIAVVHALFTLPYTYVNILSGLSGYDKRLDHAASSLGASPWRLLRTVKVPILQQFFITGALLAFLISFDEFTITRFLTGISFETLPVKFYGAAQQNLSPELAALGSLLVVALLGAAGLIAALLAVVNGRTRRTNRPNGSVHV